MIFVSAAIAGLLIGYYLGAYHAARVSELAENLLDLIFGRAESCEDALPKPSDPTTGNTAGDTEDVDAWLSDPDWWKR